MIWTRRMSREEVRKSTSTGNCLQKALKRDRKTVSGLERKVGDKPCGACQVGRRDFILRGNVKPLEGFTQVTWSCVHFQGAVWIGDQNKCGNLVGTQCKSPGRNKIFKKIVQFTNFCKLNKNYFIWSILIAELERLFLEAFLWKQKFISIAEGRFGLIYWRIFFPL